MEENYQYIVPGVIGKLLTMPKKEWSDPIIAQGYLDDFEAGIVDANSRSRDEHTGKIRTTGYGGL
ncbi:MAG: hypothetical protein ACRBBW_20570 [Cellvibrionaceae bacterium]